MPPEPTKAKLKRRSSRKDFDDYGFDGGHARELEQKRNRGEVSCAECRRLKIKCDKQIPCQSCQRRGCAALCPNGSLSTGQGTRFVLAATEHLHRRIAKYSGRIRELEDALAALQAKHSAEPHPLLHEDLIVNDDREDDGFVDGPGTVQGQAPDVIDAFGTLSISNHGISRFFGPTGGSESLLLANLNSSHDSPDSSHTPESIRGSKSPSGPTDLALFSQSFPFTPMGHTADVQELVESHLPPWDRARSLCETYFEQVSWIFHGVTRAQLMDDMLPAIYRTAPSIPGEDYSGPHDLALLFIILAVGALVQPEPSNALGEHFYQVSRAALSLQPVLEKPSIVTIQTLHLMSIYNAMSGSDLRSETSMEMTWSLITLASHLSQTIGLHRDSARWGLSPKMVQRRRILFWDLFVADVWQSLNTGRPPSFSLAYIDCSFPQSHDDKETEGGFGSAFAIWQCRFAADCVADVTSRTLTAEAPSYATIMELDRKVREFPLPESNAKDDMAGSFQRCVLDHIRETVLMYIHRSFFAQAIIEQPVNPLKSAYAPSFLAAYRASSTILKSVREQFNIWPNSCSRFWTMWTFAFSAAVVFGTVVTRGPRSPLAQSAMTELEQACILFSKASVYSIRATKALPILTKLSEKARYALAAAQKDPSSSSSDSGLLWNIKQEDTDDELSIFAGHTRFVSVKKSQCDPPKLLYPTPSSQHQNQHHIQQPHVPAAYQIQPPAQSMMHSWSQQDDQREFISLEEQTPSLHYPYVPSERTHQIEQYKEWSNPSAGRSSHQLQTSSVPCSQQRYSACGPSLLMSSSSSQQPPLAVPSQSQYCPPRHENAYPPSQLSVLHHAPRHQPQSQQQYHPHQQEYDLHLQHPHHSQQQLPQSQQHYAQPAAFRGLADLGLASRDSRLDERWSSFMEDSGLLEGLDFHGPR